MDTIMTLREMGLSAGSVAVCVSLFIWSTLQMKSLTIRVIEAREAVARHALVLAKIAEDQAKCSEQLAVVAANLINLTSSVNQVVRDLITVVRDVEK